VTFDSGIIVSEVIQ